jgi:hypothetical protein
MADVKRATLRKGQQKSHQRRAVPRHLDSRHWVTASSLAGDGGRQESHATSAGHDAGKDDHQQSHRVQGLDDISERTQLSSLAGGHTTSGDRPGSLSETSVRMQRALQWKNPQGEPHRGEKVLVEAVSLRVETWFEQQMEAFRAERRTEQQHLRDIVRTIREEQQNMGVIMDALIDRMEKFNSEQSTIKQLVTDVNGRLDTVTAMTTKRMPSGAGEARASIESGAVAPERTPVQPLSRSSSAPMSPQSPLSPWSLSPTHSNVGRDTVHLVAREPRQSEVDRVLTNGRLKDTPASDLLGLIQEITKPAQEAWKLRYAELAMSENLRKEYEALPPATRDRIDTIQSLCDLFLCNKVTMSKAPTVMTLRPTASNGHLPSELAANLQFLTNLRLANGYSSTSNADLQRTASPNSTNTLALIAWQPVKIQQAKGGFGTFSLDWPIWVLNPPLRTTIPVLFLRRFTDRPAVPGLLDFDWLPCY